jgi:site-specific recombinase XerD
MTKNCRQAFHHYRICLNLAYLKESGMEQTTVTVSKILQNGINYLKVVLPKEPALIEKIKRIQGRQWSPDLKAWLLPKELAIWQSFQNEFKDTKYIIERDGKTIIHNPEVMTAQIIKVKTAEFWKGRLRVDLPYKKDWIEKIRQVEGRRWHSEQQCWTIPDSPLCNAQLKSLFGDNLQFDLTDKEPPVKRKPKVLVNGKKEKIELMYSGELTKLEEKLLLKRMSYNTIKTYKNSFAGFLKYYENIHPESITEQQIKDYLLKLIRENNISVSYQNTTINAIKFYYEQVLGRPRTYYDLERPKKPFVLPDILTEEEVVRLLGAAENIKHKCILLTIYSGGLRLGELVNLRIKDVQKTQNCIFIKGGKGKKDRQTLLSPVLLEHLRHYYRQFQPQYWLFEGQYGGQYSPRSVQSILRAAVEKSGVNPYATVHTLRHSFATHLLSKGVNLRYIQALLGHESSKTTEIYTHITGDMWKVVQSPLDGLKL